MSAGAIRLTPGSTHVIERWRVDVCEGEQGMVLSYVFNELPITIGRHEGNDVLLPRPFVSGFHARIERARDGLSVLDAGSTNGVRVRREGEQPTRIEPDVPEALSCCGNEFFIGAYRISIQQAAAAPASPGLEQPSLPALGSSPFLRLDGLASGLPSLPAPHRGEPRAAGAPGTASERRALEATALAELEQLARVLAPEQRLDTPEKVSELIRRLRLALELACRGLVRLREGQRRCAGALRLPRLGPDAGLRAESADQLARRLLDERLPVAELCAGLSAEFQSLARHQVALLDGMIAGAAALLGELSPEQIEARSERERGAHWLPLAGKLRALRRAYREHHAQLSRRDGALSLVFGRAFRDAYAAYLDGASRSAPDGSARRRRKLG
jgi:predicted component of type VI protein secretion system